MTAPKPVATPAAAKSDGTEYVILSRNSGYAGQDVDVSALSSWTEQAERVTARDTEKAIEKYAAANGNKPGTFVAVPASRWKPVNVTAETVTTLKLEEAK